MFQWPWPSWDTYLWEEQPEITERAALIPLDKVIDITSYMDTAGNLAWEVPEGTWKIIRSGMAPTGVQNSPASPEAVGLEVDKMSKKLSLHTLMLIWANLCAGFPLKTGNRGK